VISAHTLGMYAFSIISGRMTDRWGRGQVIISGAVVMIVSCLIAAPSSGLLALMAALFLLRLQEFEPNGFIGPTDARAVR
jgi:MFS family permease